MRCGDLPVTATGVASWFFSPFPTTSSPCLYPCMSFCLSSRSGVGLCPPPCCCHISPGQAAPSPTSRGLSPPPGPLPCCAAGAECSCLRCQALGKVRPSSSRCQGQSQPQQVPTGWSGHPGISLSCMGLWGLVYGNPNHAGLRKCPFPARSAQEEKSQQPWEQFALASTLLSLAFHLSEASPLRALLLLPP